MINLKNNLSLHVKYFYSDALKFSIILRAQMMLWKAFFITVWKVVFIKSWKVVFISVWKLLFLRLWKTFFITVWKVVFMRLWKVVLITGMKSTVYDVMKSGFHQCIKSTFYGVMKSGFHQTMKRIFCFYRIYFLLDMFLFQVVFFGAHIWGFSRSFPVLGCPFGWFEFWRHRLSQVVI